MLAMNLILIQCYTAILITCGHVDDFFGRQAQTTRTTVCQEKLNLWHVRETVPMASVWPRSLGFVRKSASKGEPGVNCGTGCQVLSLKETNSITHLITFN